MKFKKTTVLGVVLSLMLVVGVTVAFASGPKAPAGQGGDPNDNTPYEVCADPLCAVDYQHCHIDGEVVRAYDEYPGLLCAHPDCEIEGPHEHDGVQYAGQAGTFVVLSRNPGPLPSGDPVFVEDGNPVPVSTGPIIVADGDPGVTPPRPVTLEEYGALLEGLMSGGKLSREDADWLLANAKEDMEGQECPYLWVVDGGSYAVMGGNICTLAGCGNNSRHTHDGEWYTGWTGKTAIPPYCTDEDCTVSGLHYHQQDGEVVYCYDTLPAELPVCPVEGCTETRYHAHIEGRAVLLSDPCPVEGCAITGSHIHGDVCYSCNGAGHSGGVCDWSCYHYAGEGGGTAPSAVPSAAPVSSGHHGAGHGNGYQGGHH